MIIFCKNWRTIFFFNLFSRFSVFFDIFSIFRYFPVGFGVQYRKSLILKKKIRKKKIKKNFFEKIFSIFTEFWYFFGIFGISGLLKIWVIPFNSIEYWKCSIPKFQYYWIPKKIPIPIFLPTLLRSSKSKGTFVI